MRGLMLFDQQELVARGCHFEGGPVVLRWETPGKVMEVWPDLKSFFHEYGTLNTIKWLRMRPDNRHG